MAARTSMTQAEVFEHFGEKWADEDRAFVKAEVKRLGVKTWEAPPSRSYVIGLDTRGDSVLAVEKGNVNYVEANKHEDAVKRTSENRWEFRLTTHRSRRAEGKPAAAEAKPVEAPEPGPSEGDVADFVEKLETELNETRDERVLRMIADGIGRKAIAESEGISVATVGRIARKSA